MFKSQIRDKRQYKETQITLLEMKTTLGGINVRLEIAEKILANLKTWEKKISKMKYKWEIF